MFESMIAGFQSRHDISQAAVSELGDLLQQAALSSYSVLQTVHNAPASVMLDGQEGSPVVEAPGDDVDATTTGRYDDLRLLGTGGMGEVRRVRDKEHTPVCKGNPPQDLFPVIKVLPLVV
jgi:hypothetical protein